MQEAKMVAEKTKEYEVIGHLVERSRKNSRSPFEVEIEVDNVVLSDDIKTGCITINQFKK